MIKSPLSSTIFHQFTEGIDSPAAKNTRIFKTKRANWRKFFKAEKQENNDESMMETRRDCEDLRAS
jgi:hypothetical protein